MPATLLTPLTSKNLPQLLTLEALCFPHGWSCKQWQEELLGKDSICLGVFADILIAAISCRTMLEELWIFRLMVHPQHRRQHWAAHLLKQALLTAQNQAGPCLIDSIWLETRADNLAAIHFYKKQHFLPVSVRKGYYPAAGSHKKATDAIVMSKKITLMAYSSHAT